MMVNLSVACTKIVANQFMSSQLKVPEQASYIFKFVLYLKEHLKVQLNLENNREFDRLASGLLWVMINMIYAAEDLSVLRELILEQKILDEIVK